MAKYIQYCEKTAEEQPLYLFDNDFGEKVPQFLNDYQVPVYFQGKPLQNGGRKP